MGEKLSDDELKEFYKGEYVETYKDKPLYRLERLLKYFECRKADVVGDFGCGDGMLAEVLKDGVAEYRGVDFSEEFIRAARNRISGRNFTNATFECDDIDHFCKRYPNYYDKAFTLDFSEHIYDDVFREVYASIRHSLKDRGKLFIHTPNANFFIEVLKRTGIMRQFPEHIAVRNAEHYVRLLKEVGFEKIDVHYLPHYLGVLAPFHVFSGLPLLGRYFKARLLISCEK